MAGVIHFDAFEKNCCVYLTSPVHVHENYTTIKPINHNEEG